MLPGHTSLRPQPLPPSAGWRPSAAVPSLPRQQGRRQLHVVAAKKGGKKGGGQKKGPGSLMNPPKPAEPWLQVPARCMLPGCLPCSCQCCGGGVRLAV